jgi:hypothetical protein
VKLALGATKMDERLLHRYSEFGHLGAPQGKGDLLWRAGLIHARLGGCKLLHGGK